MQTIGSLEFEKHVKRIGRCQHIITGSGGIENQCKRPISSNGYCGTHDPTKAKKRKESLKQNQLLLCHELLDRISLLQQLFHGAIADHPAGRPLKKQMQLASDAISDLYQAAGIERFKQAD